MKTKSDIFKYAKSTAADRFAILQAIKEGKRIVFADIDDVSVRTMWLLAKYWLPTTAWRSYYETQEGGNYDLKDAVHPKILRPLFMAYCMTVGIKKMTETMRQMNQEENREEFCDTTLPYAMQRLQERDMFVIFITRRPFFMHYETAEQMSIILGCDPVILYMKSRWKKQDVTREVPGEVIIIDNHIKNLRGHRDGVIPIWYNANRPTWEYRAGSEEEIPCVRNFLDFINWLDFAKK